MAIEEGHMWFAARIATTRGVRFLGSARTKRLRKKRAKDFHRWWESLVAGRLLYTWRLPAEVPAEESVPP